MKDLVKQWKRDENAIFQGWDFSYLRNRTIEERPYWDYSKIAIKLVEEADSVLDMGTGGGEIFYGILKKAKKLPKKIVATEGYKPNVIVSRKKLKPLNVKLVDFSKLNVKKMPFKNGKFDLILNRHDTYDIKEVYRILKKGGKFLTQQVSKDNDRDFKKAFNVKVNSRHKDMLLSIQKKEFIKAGFKILKFGDWRGYYIFKDVGALVYYLKAVPWTIKDFSVDKHIFYLGKLQKKLEKDKNLKFASKRFFILAKK